VTSLLLERGVTLVLALMTLVAGALAAASLIERRQLQAAAAHVARETVHEAPASPLGFDRSGARVDIPPRVTGLAIRYASSRCPYCRGDKEWHDLAARLRKRGLFVILLLPAARDEFKREAVVPDGAPQEAYVSIGWIKRYRLTATPTLLLFDEGRRLIWHREGQLRIADTHAALQAVDTAARRR
jgi:hypothetical protein